MKQMLRDYELSQGTISLFINNKSAIDISKNLVHHLRTKHIDIRHHFIRELVEEKAYQLVDILTKPLDSRRFKYLRSAIGLCAMV